MTNDLRCIYDHAKSFYGKAIIIPTETGYKLKSYETIVAEIKNNKPIVYGTYSQTTLRHIKEFLKQKGFKANDINDVRNYFLTKEEKEENVPKGLFNSIKMICAFGDLMNTTQKDKNDFKKRILNAGLKNKGLSFPDNWDNLTETEKENRINNAVEQL